MHTPYTSVIPAKLQDLKPSPSFTKSSIRGHRKNSQKLCETNKFDWEGWGFSNKSHFRFQMVFCVHIGMRVEAWRAKYFFFGGGGGRGGGGGEGFQVKLILFVSLGFCELLRWPLTSSRSFVVSSHSQAAHCANTIRRSAHEKKV